MIQKFKESWDLDVRRGRGRKRISNKTVKEVVFAVVEKEFSSEYSASRARAVSRDLSFTGLQCERF